MVNMKIDKELLVKLMDQAVCSTQSCAEYNLGSSETNAPQMLKALMPGMKEEKLQQPAPVNVICLCGKLDIVLYKQVKEQVTFTEGLDRGMDAQDVICRNVLVESDIIHLCPATAEFGCVIPANTWYSVMVSEPCVVYLG